MNETLWQTILNSYIDNPRDVATTPTRGEPKWFYVCVDNDNLHISPSHLQIPQSNVKPHTLDKQNIDRVLELHRLRKRGLLKRTDARGVTHNSSYWFGIFDDLGL